MEILGIIGFICFGLFVGVVARLIKPGRQNLSMVMTLVLGVVGALIGGLVASMIGTGTFGDMDLIGGIVAIIAAVLLIGVAEGASSSKKTHV
jgi:uncharacterized membrane protein YeaQ/YmgE (transglycosylase-associated protein family)